MENDDPPKCKKCGRQCRLVYDFHYAGSRKAPGRYSVYEMWYDCRGGWLRRLLWFMKPCSTGGHAFIEKGWFDWGKRAAKIRYGGSE